MGCRLSQLAEQDLIDLFLDGVEKFGLRHAEAYNDLLANTFGFLADNPKAARLREEIDTGVRIHPVQAQLVVIRVEADDEVVIIRVRDGHEDWVTDGSCADGVHPLGHWHRCHPSDCQKRRFILNIV